MVSGLELSVKATPTRYQGVNFRSRLEAKWAAYFDLVRWRWTYEPVDLNGWIPDFAIASANNQTVFAEVKPFCDSTDPIILRTQQELERAYKGPSEILILGASLLVPESGYASIGFLAERMGEFDATTNTEREQYWWQHAVAVCGGYDFRAEYGSYYYRVTGDSNGGHPDDAELADVEYLWREAGNRVQWKPGR